MNEPDWCNMGYAANGYQAECNSCGEVAHLEFGKDEKYLTTFRAQDDIGASKQTELCEVVFTFVLIKLRGLCTCDTRRRRN
ncbi:hypothetical protein M199_gp278 [Halogranum tailed virus 1]|uniref:Uncharacterized protein n=1 Tax=Halogranum tailed virus 1 TaxID=1273749 RepID=R4TML0_9CAUD|nr:hypothetical protein M199_gp278 [Halogranum tailed virus 1]AGM11388.1 hypothetical protein HGTV1_62 [Halogranum tailed virus 1]